MKCLVTGGAGFIGSHLVEELLSLNHQVTVIDDLSLGKESNLKKNKNLKFHKETILNQNIKDIIQGHDVIFHLAALPRVQFSIQNPILTNEVNIKGTLNLLEAAKQAKIKRFIFTSSSSVYGNQDKLPLVETMAPNPMSPYALHKLVGEYYCKLYNLIHGMETISLRYFNVYGPRQDPSGGYACLVPKFINMIINNKQPIINGNGNQTRDFTYVKDVVNANIKAALTNNKEAFNQSFNIGASNNISVNQVTDLIVKLAKSKVKPIHGPSVIEPKDTKADIQKAKKLLNWQPETSFEKGLKLTYESMIK